MINIKILSPGNFCFCPGGWPCFLILCFFLVLGTGCDFEPIKKVSGAATSISIPPPTLTSAGSTRRVDYVVIQKSDHVMSLWKEGRIVKTYPILAFGADPYGTKTREGDEKTPEGTYYIDGKHPSQKFQKFLKISYPNEKDKLQAQKNGVSPGGNVGIHGDMGGISGFFQRMHKNWTDGCIAVRNAHIEEIYEMVDVGTPIMIQP
jgi:murein L,D-transpeptidase YafK